MQSVAHYSSFNCAENYTQTILYIEFMDIKGKIARLFEKQRLYKIIFEADTPAGKRFDIAVMIAILLSLLISFVESMPAIAGGYKLALNIMEYVLTLFFTIEYALRLYCSPVPRKYAFSFFGIIDLLATLPLYLSFFLPTARYMLVLRAFRLTRVFRVFKLFSFINEGYLIMQSIRLNKRIIRFKLMAI